MSDTLETLAPQSSDLSINWYTVDYKGLRATRVPSWDEWEGGLSGLATLQHALPMIIGDYINVGEDTFGEKFEQVLDVFGEYSYGSVANYASICRSVPYERRENGLTMAHYKAIRTLDPEEQIRWQQTAKYNGWTSLELWDNVHGNERSLLSMIEDVIEDIGLLYSYTPTSEADDYLSEAQRQMQELSRYVKEQEERTKITFVRDTPGS